MTDHLQILRKSRLSCYVTGGRQTIENNKWLYRIDVFVFWKTTQLWNLKTSEKSEDYRLFLYVLEFRWNADSSGFLYLQLWFLWFKFTFKLDTNMLPQQYCLRWRYHHSNLQTMFSQLLDREAFCDVTLACEGRTIKAHKIVLSACSTYFETILSQYEEKDPILIMKDVKYIDIKCLVEFMYKGEINVEHVSKQCFQLIYLQNVH